jgi:hypothetical protein
VVQTCGALGMDGDASAHVAAWGAVPRTEEVRRVVATTVGGRGEVLGWGMWAVCADCADAWTAVDYCGSVARDWGDAGGRHVVQRRSICVHHRCVRTWGRSRLRGAGCEASI